MNPKLISHETGLYQRCLGNGKWGIGYKKANTKFNYGTFHYFYKYKPFVSGEVLRIQMNERGPIALKKMELSKPPEDVELYTDEILVVIGSSFICKN